MNWNSCLDKSGQVLELTCIPLLVQVAVFWLLSFAGIVALFLIIYGGIRFMFSHGDPKAVDTARKTIVYAAIGLAVVLFSFLIVNFISYVTGTGCINNFGFSNCNAGQAPNS